MTTNDEMTDDEAVANEEPSREELLARGANPTPRKLGKIKLRPITPETISYLWELKNMFVYRDESGNVARNNPMLAVAEFVYIHSGDIDEVAENMSKPRAMRAAVRELMNKELFGSSSMEEAVSVIDGLLKEYIAAQAEVDALAAKGGKQSGKA